MRILLSGAGIHFSTRGLAEHLYLCTPQGAADTANSLMLPDSTVHFLRVSPCLPHSPRAVGTCLSYPNQAIILCVCVPEHTMMSVMLLGRQTDRKGSKPTQELRS